MEPNKAQARLPESFKLSGSSSNERNTCEKTIRYLLNAALPTQLHPFKRKNVFLHRNYKNPGLYQ